MERYVTARTVSANILLKYFVVQRRISSAKNAEDTYQFERKYFMTSESEKREILLKQMPTPCLSDEFEGGNCWKIDEAIPVILSRERALREEHQKELEAWKDRADKERKCITCNPLDTALEIERTMDKEREEHRKVLEEVLLIIQANLSYWAITGGGTYPSYYKVINIINAALGKE